MNDLFSSSKQGKEEGWRRLEKHKHREYAHAAEKSGCQFYAAPMEKHSLTQG